MADGGASSFIMLVTALLISGSVSAILVTEWGKATTVIQKSERKATYESAISIEFAGDPAMVSYDVQPGVNDTISFYVLNSGSHEMSTIYDVLIDGLSPGSTTESIVPSGTEWLPGYLLLVSVDCLLYTSPSPRD